MSEINDLARSQSEPGSHPSDRTPSGFDASGVSILRAQMARLKADNAVLRAELAENHIVSARLTAWMEGNGGVEIVLAGGRRIALALDTPYGETDPALKVAREARLGQSAHLGKLPDRLFAAMMDGVPREVTDLIRLAEPGATRKQVYNALGYLTRRGYVERLRYGTYRAVAAQGIEARQGRGEDSACESPVGQQADAPDPKREGEMKKEDVA